MKYNSKVIPRQHLIDFFLPPSIHFKLIIYSQSAQSTVHTGRSSNTLALSPSEAETNEIEFTTLSSALRLLSNLSNNYSSLGTTTKYL